MAYRNVARSQARALTAAACRGSENILLVIAAKCGVVKPTRIMKAQTTWQDTSSIRRESKCRRSERRI
jgi:hypothetical protein